MWIRSRNIETSRQMAFHCSFQLKELQTTPPDAYRVAENCFGMMVTALALMTCGDANPPLSSTKHHAFPPWIYGWTLKLGAYFFHFIPGLQETVAGGPFPVYVSKLFHSNGGLKTHACIYSIYACARRRPAIAGRNQILFPKTPFQIM